MICVWKCGYCFSIFHLVFKDHTVDKGGLGLLEQNKNYPRLCYDKDETGKVKGVIVVYIAG